MKNGLEDWFKWLAEARRSSKMLYVLYGKTKRLKRPNEQKADALFDGYWALKREAEEHERAIIQRGGLLFLTGGAA